MDAHAADIHSSACAALNGVHDGSSAEHSPATSRISSESPTVTPGLTLQFDASMSPIKDGDHMPDVNGLASNLRFSEVTDDEFVSVAKIEEIDDPGVSCDVHLNDNIPEELDIKPDLASLDSVFRTELSSAVVSRRPRGRPRKHPKSEQVPLAKKPMGRSKTGCITCRRRKKKCDERKPTCMHCEKNNVQCEGYQPRDIWQSGKQKALARAQRRWSVEGPSPLPSIMPGVENEMDWFFFEHFNLILSNLLSVQPERNNPFRDQLLPMAQSHRGLMHSLLSLSGTHLLVKRDSTPKERIEERSVWHFDKALTLLRTDENMSRCVRGDPDVRLPAPTVAQVVILCLHTICEGDTTGVYRRHLSALKSMLEGNIDTKEEEYLRFLSEFLIYHDMSAAITSRRPTLVMSDNFQVPSFIAEGARSFLGVCDGLFGSTSKTRQLRDRVRTRREQQQRPYVDFNTIMDGKAIDADLKAATCSYEIGSDEWVAWNLYKTTFWLYLHRTLNNSTPSQELDNGVSKAIEYIQAIPPNSSVQSVLLTPIFIVACAAFNEEQRPAIIEAFEVLERYSSLGNIKHAKRVVDQVWRFMDVGNDRSWDWEGIMEEMDMNFLVT